MDDLVTIETLPVEIISSICHRLNTTDLCSFRWGNKNVASRMDEHFRTRFFKKKQFMISSFSLGTLKDISKSNMAPYLEHLLIGCDLLTDDHSPSDPIQAMYYQQATEDQLDLFRTGHAIDMLVEILGALPNLKTISIRDYNFTSKHARPGDSNELASYGAPTLQRQTGLHPMSLNSWRQGARNMMGQIFFVVLVALGRSNVRLDHLEILRHCSGYLDPTAFSLPDYVSDDIKPALQNLKNLLLSLTTVSTGQGQYNGANTTSHFHPVTCSDLTIRQFLTHLTSLEHLRLNFQPGEYPENLMKWLAKPVTNGAASNAAVAPASGAPASAPIDLAVAMAADPALLDSPLSTPPTVLPNLRRLDFGTVSLKHEVLIEVFRKHMKTLRQINLHKVTFIDDQRRVVGDNKRNNWLHFLRAFRNLPKFNITEMKISEPSQTDSFQGRYPMHFKSSSSSSTSTSRNHSLGKGKARERSFRGSRLKDWVAEVERDMVTERPNTNPNPVPVPVPANDSTDDQSSNDEPDSSGSDSHSDSEASEDN